MKAKSVLLFPVVRYSLSRFDVTPSDPIVNTKRQIDSADDDVGIDSDLSFLTLGVSFLSR